MTLLDLSGLEASVDKACAEIDRLRTERAELLAALKECSFRLATLIAAHADFSDANARACDLALAAIAKAEGR